MVRLVEQRIDCDDLLAVQICIQQIIHGLELACRGFAIISINSAFHALVDVVVADALDRI